MNTTKNTGSKTMAVAAAMLRDALGPFRSGAVAAHKAGDAEFIADALESLHGMAADVAELAASQSARIAELEAALRVLVESCTPVSGDTPRTPHPAKVAAARSLLSTKGG